MRTRFQFWSACLGNLFEHYDTALFGFLTPFLAPLIFPQQKPIIALILAYAIIPLGMLARPIGSLVFGYIGDRYGRKQALFLTLGGMSIISGLIALTPTCAVSSLAAPFILCLGRILQNFFAAGESMGGAIFMLENSHEKNHDLLSALFSSSTIGGILLASAGVSLLSYYDTLEGGWRYLFFIGCMTGLFGCFIRNLDDPTPTTSCKGANLNLGSVLWTFRREFTLIAICSGFSYASYSVSLILMNAFIPLISSYTNAEMMVLNTWLLILDFCCLPIFGWLSSKISREKLMVNSTLIVFTTTIPLLLFSDLSLAMMIGLRIWFVVIGVAFSAPLHAWAQQLIPASHRYLIISFGYALGTQLLGGPTTVVSLWLFNQTGIASSIVWYWSFLALLCYLFLIKFKKNQQYLKIDVLATLPGRKFIISRTPR